jgi:hypothetical protein
VRAHTVSLQLYPMEKNTAEKRAVTREVKTWRSRVNATIRLVHSRFRQFVTRTPLTRPANNRQIEQSHIPTMRPRRRRIDCEVLKQSLSLLLSCCLVLASAPGGLAAQADQSGRNAGSGRATNARTAAATGSADRVVSGCFGGADPRRRYLSRPSVEADRWLQQHTDLKGEQLGKEVDKQPWDPSVKALVEFPSVLANMDKNLSWTSSLGDAYVNQEQDVMNAVQVMRDRAEKAGNLKSTSQEKVSNQGQTIVIEPADPEVVYVPEYDPWLVYGEPIGIWPGWYWYPGLYLTGPGFGWGLGFGIGFFGGFGWGWGHWGYDWHNHGIMFNHGAYISHSRVFVNRNNFNRAGGFHGGGFAGGRGFASSERGFSTPHAQAALIPELLAGSIMEEWQEVSPPVGSRALAEAFMEVEVSTEAGAVAGNSVQLRETKRD